MLFYPNTAPRGDVETVTDVFGVLEAGKGELLGEVVNSSLESFLWIDGSGDLA